MQVKNLFLILALASFPLVVIFSRPLSQPYTSRRKPVARKDSQLYLAHYKWFLKKENINEAMKF